MIWRPKKFDTWTIEDFSRIITVKALMIPEKLEEGYEGYIHFTLKKRKYVCKLIDISAHWDPLDDVGPYYMTVRLRIMPRIHPQEIQLL